MDLPDRGRAGLRFHFRGVLRRLRESAYDVSARFGALLVAPKFNRIGLYDVTSLPEARMPREDSVICCARTIHLIRRNISSGCGGIFRIAEIRGDNVSGRANFSCLLIDFDLRG